MKMNAKTDVSIIIVNYNTKHLLANCIQSIYNKTDKVCYEVIVVDNASSDGSEEYIKLQFPKVIWINSRGNIGFGRANNWGASQATGKYLFLLNSDTILKNNAILMFYQYMESYAEKDQIGAIGCWLLDNDTNINFSCGEFPTPRSEFSYVWKKIAKRKPMALATKDVDFITGADLFLPKEVFRKMGGFDSNIFMYYEETDLQYRMAKSNLKRRIIMGPQIIHLEGGSFMKKGLSFNRFIMSQTSFNYYIKKHYSGVMFYCFRLSLITIRLLLFITTDWSIKEKMEAYMLVLNGKS